MSSAGMVVGLKGGDMLGGESWKSKWNGQEEMGGEADTAGLAGFIESPPIEPEILRRRWPRLLCAASEKLRFHHICRSKNRKLTE